MYIHTHQFSGAPLANNQWWLEGLILVDVDDLHFVIYLLLAGHHHCCIGRRLDNRPRLNVDDADAFNAMQILLVTAKRCLT